MILAIMLAGLATLGLSVWSWRRNRRLAIADMPPLWRNLWRLRWVIGVVLGCGSYFLHYPWEGGDGTYTVYGVPFMSFAFDQEGRDYVGPLTIPALIMNFIVWVWLPQPLFWFFARRLQNRPAA